jgi:hypothetical protein
MSRNRHVRAPSFIETEDAVTVTVGLVGAKFKCLVEKDWPCESLVASAIAEYHLAFPTCEVPDCSTIYHIGRKEHLEPKDPVGQWCRDGDEIELGMRDRPLADSSNQAPPPADEGLNFHTYDFTIVFHRLPLGFALKQEMDATVVANIYPKTAATHYERLVPGTIVVQMGDTPLEDMGLRQVHEVIRHCKLPLPIRFRGWKKPVARAAFTALADNTARNVASPRLAPAPKSEPHALPQRRKSAPAPSSERSASSGNAGSRGRATTEIVAAPEPEPVAEAAMFNSASEDTAQSASAPSPYSHTKQKIMSERKKTNASSPYADHRTMAAERRLSRGGRQSPIGELSVPLVDQLDAISNQGDSPSSVADLKLKQKEFHLHGGALNLNGVVDQLAATSIGEPSHEEHLRQCEVHSNQNEDESEEMLVEHIKILQAELIKKQEEAKQLANQLDKYRARLNAVQQKEQSAATVEKPAPAVAAAPGASAPNLTLTPEVLEAIEAKQGLPPKSKYNGSNASSMSGYSSYSNRSAMKRHSAYRREGSSGSNFGDGLKSPRRQPSQNVNNRYNYIPPKYEAPSSFSTKGGLISRAKVTRDSYIKIPDTPGVGAYDVKLPRERVRGGEIGDSDRSLPWP